MIIRELNTQDADNFLEMLLQLDNETTNMMFEPNERPNDVTSIHDMIRSSKHSSSTTFLVFEDEKCIGFLSVKRGNLKRIRHTAYIVIGVLQAFRRKGIGNALFAELENWAKQHDIKRLELTVMTHNQAGIHLYKKNGFEIEGIKKHSMLVNGEYVDEYYMSKLL